MATVTSPRRSSKSKPFSCSFVAITVAINDVRYSVDETNPGEFGSKSFRLVKHAGDHEVYDVLRTHSGIVSCSCPDYVARHEGNGYGMCKHVRSLVELGLMAAPIAPEFAPRAIAVPEPEPCCSPVEAAPCMACVPSPAIEPVADVFPPDLVDPNDAESDANLWGPEWDAEVWMSTEDDVWTTTDIDPVPDGDDDHLLNTVEPSPWHAPFSPAPYEPTEQDRQDSAEIFGAMEAQAHLDRSDRLTLAELVERQVQFYENWKNPAGQMFADAMTKLLMQVRLTSATCPAELDARIDAMEADARDAWQTAGYEEGRRVGAGIDVYA